MFWVEQLFQKYHSCFPSHFRSINNVEHHPETLFEPLSVEVHHQPQQRYKMVGLGVGGVVGFTILVGAARLLQKNSRRDPPPLDPLDPDMGSNSIGLPPPLDLGMRSNSLGLPPPPTTTIRINRFPGFPPPPIPINPNLVKLSIYSSKCERLVDIGVIVSSDGHFVTVLGRAYFIYNYKISEGGPRKLHQGKVTVALQGDKFYLDGPTFQAHVVHVDFSHHVAILKFACSRQFPTVDFCSCSDLSFGQQLLSFYLGASQHYIHDIHIVRGVPNGGVCGGAFHVDARMEWGHPGVFVLDGKLIGLQMTRCPKDESLLHGLPFECCTENLKLSSNLSVDVRCSLPKADVNVGVLVPLHGNDKEPDMVLMLRELKAEVGIMQMRMEEIISVQRQLPSSNMRERQSTVAMKYKEGPSKAKGKVVLDIEDDIVPKEERGNEAGESEEERDKTEKEERGNEAGESEEEGDKTDETGESG